MKRWWGKIRSGETWILYLAKSPKRSKRSDGRPDRKKTDSWSRKVTTVASWNSLKLSIRYCISIPGGGGKVKDLESGGPSGGST